MFSFLLAMLYYNDLPSYPPPPLFPWLVLLNPARPPLQVETVMENSRGETLAAVEEDRDKKSPSKVTFSEEVRRKKNRRKGRVPRGLEIRSIKIIKKYSYLIQSAERPFSRIWRAWPDLEIILSKTIKQVGCDWTWPLGKYLEESKLSRLGFHITYVLAMIKKRDEISRFLSQSAEEGAADILTRLAMWKTAKKYLPPPPPPKFIPFLPLLKTDAANLHLF